MIDSRSCIYSSSSSDGYWPFQNNPNELCVYKAHFNEHRVIFGLDGLITTPHFLCVVLWNITMWVGIIVHRGIVHRRTVDCSKLYRTESAILIFIKIVNEDCLIIEQVKVRLSDVCGNRYLIIRSTSPLYESIWKSFHFYLLSLLLLLSQRFGWNKVYVAFVSY